MGRESRKVITLSVVSNLGVDETVYDAKVHGFGVRRQRATASYFVKLRVDGQQRWVTIGRHGQPTATGEVWTPDNARRRAQQIIGNPSIIDRPARSEQFQFADAADLFIEQHGPMIKPRSRAEYERLTRLYLKPAFGKRTLANIARADITAAHRGWRDTPRSANFALTVLSKLFSWAKDEGHFTGENPVRGIKRYRERQCTRFLTLEEIRRLGEAIDEAVATNRISVFAGAAFRLLLLTGARRNEIAMLEWRFVDLERGMLFLPESKTNEKVIVLSDEARELLASIPRQLDNPYVIGGPIEGQPYRNLYTPWRVVRKMAMLEDVRIHDLRHTSASLMAMSGASLPVIGRQLGHRSPRTTQRYAHLTDETVRSAVQKASSLVATALGGRENA